MSNDLESILERLGPWADESVVISAAALLDDGVWNLVFASVLVGPRSMADQSWVSWFQESQRQDLHVESLLAATSRPLDSWITFDHRVNDWRFLRFSISLDDLRDFLANLLERGQLNLPSDEKLKVVYLADLLPVRTLSHETTSTSRLVAAAGRPTTGWHAHLHASNKVSFAQAGDPGEHVFPDNWIVDGVQISDGALFLLGFATSQLLGPDEPPKPGIIVSRVDRQAWLGELRGSANFETYVVTIVRESDGPMLWDLEIDVEERVELDLLGSRRLRLSDIRLPSVDAMAIAVALPTLGRGITRRVRLSDRDGNLLDGSDDLKSVESMSITMNDLEFKLFEAPQSNAVTSLQDRLTRMKNVESGYATLLQDGAEDRVVAIGDDGITRLAEMLKAASGELLVFDPYWSTDQDWEVLKGVPIPIRLLTGRQGAGPRVTLKLASSSISVKRWTGSTPNPFFHDRAYLWRGGGLQTGSSPSGMGKRLSLIDILSPTMVVDLTARFETWWASGDFTST